MFGLGCWVCFWIVAGWFCGGVLLQLCVSFLFVFWADFVYLCSCREMLIVRYDLVVGVVFGFLILIDV